MLYNQFFQGGMTPVVTRDSSNKSYKFFLGGGAGAYAGRSPIHFTLSIILQVLSFSYNLH